MQEALASEPAVAGSLLAGLCLLALAVALGRRPRLVAAHPLLVLGAVGVVSAAAALALVRLDPPGLRLSLDPSTEPLLPRGDPARATYERAVREFGDDEVFVIALESQRDLFNHADLSLLDRVHREIAQLPGVRSVQSLADTVGFRYDAAEDWIDVGRLFDAVPETPEALAALRERVLADPLMRRTLVSPDARAAGIAVRFREMTDGEFIDSGLDEAIGAVLERAGRPGIRFHVAGRPHAKAGVYRGMVHDLTVLIPLAVGALAAVLAFATGTRRGVVLPLANVLLATLWTFGAMAAFGRPLTILSTMLAPLLIAIGSVYGVHLLARYDEERSVPDDPREPQGPEGQALRAMLDVPEGQALRAMLSERTLEHAWLPVAISGATTQIGFAALLASQVPAVSELGAFAVLGVGCVTLLTTAGLPAALALLPARREVSALPAWLARWSERFELELGRGLAWLGPMSVRRSGRLLFGAATLAAVALLAIPRIVIDTDYLSFFDEDAPLRRDFESVDRLLSGAIPIYVVLRGDGPGAFREPEALRALERLQARADAIPGVSRSVSMADWLRTLNRVVEADDPAAERIPDSRPAVSELIQLFPKDELLHFTNASQSAANLVLRTGEVGSAAVRRLTARVRAALRDELPAGIEGEPTGNAILLARSADGIAAAQGWSVALAAAAIFVFVSGSLGSLRLGALAMVPNLLPVLLYFGLLGLGAAPLSLPTSLIGSTALGISIDDTVHFLVRYRNERRAGRSPEEAAVVTTRRVGAPMVITSLVLSVGFLVIALSGFATLRQFGVLSAATMGICIAGDLLLLPALVTRARA